jgi:hypothetical protein
MKETVKTITGILIVGVTTLTGLLIGSAIAEKCAYSSEKKEAK